MEMQKQPCKYNKLTNAKIQGTKFKSLTTYKQQYSNSNSKSKK